MLKWQWFCHAPSLMTIFSNLRVGSGSSLQDAFDELLMILRISVCVAGSNESIVDVAEGNMVLIGGHERGFVVASSSNKTFLMVSILPTKNSEKLTRSDKL